MNDEVKIITLTPNEWQKYRDIRLEALKEEPTAFLTSYEDEIDDPDEKWQERLGRQNVIFAEVAGEIIGMVGFFLNNHPKAAHVAHVWGTYVKPAVRGRGIGRKLMEAIIEKIRANPKTEKIKIEVNPEQVQAYSLYKKLGFKEIGRAEKEISVGGKYYDEILMERLFRPAVKRGPQKQ